ncbi:MAG TPA: DUF2142 domain-containing protein, partial [Dissulfurispiraceae bacterium]|nr:DUF2142 domain-containing protein [Dissulfurispiraceae bacterium]
MHFRRAYHISEGHLVAEKISFMGREIAGGIIPDRELIIEIFALNSYPYSVENERLMLPSLINQGDDNFQSGRKFKIDNILTLFRQTVPPTSDEPLSFVYFPFTARYSPHLYFPQATGIELGKLIGLPMIALLYMGRLFNLLLWVFLIYLAIRVTPVSKWLFLLFALTPTSLFLSSSSSADAVTNGLSILFIACLLQLAFGDNRNRFLVAAIFALALLVSISKGY